MRWFNSEGNPPTDHVKPHLGIQLARWGILFVGIWCCLALTSCSTSRAARSKADAELRRAIGFWRPSQMYLLDSPHPRLYVEVDAVEGCSPSEETLNKLRGFLAAHCKKPGGIEVVRSDVIPLDQARGVLPSALARKYLSGPPEKRAGAPPAFLYLLFFNDVVSERPSVGETGHPGARTVRHLRLQNRNPHVDVLPYPAMIYMNVHWGPKSMHDGALLHEAGHALGLAFRPDKASGGHCLNRPCLMLESVPLVRYLLGLDPGLGAPLCERCLAQLAESQAQSPTSNLRFVGPVLVRSEDGYHVLSLPGRVKVILGELSEGDCREFAAQVRAETPSPRAGETEWSADASGKQEMLSDPDKLGEIITRINADPEYHVRRIASRLWAVCAGGYNARGQFAEAVEACCKGIRANPSDGQTYNLLAWVKATCPDASVRDGKGAVSAATKACELTHWKDWNWIDTLAAACAETGDFKRAVKLQEQALRLGHPTESDQKGMRERIALYRQSQPYHEKR